MSSVPLLILRPKYTFFPALSEKIAFMMPGLKFDLEKSDLGMKPARYASLALLNASFFAGIFTILLFITLHFGKGRALQLALSQSLGIGLASLLGLLMLLLIYPSIIAGKKAENVDNNLVFALKDLHLQVSAGVNLYHAMMNVSENGYGVVSVEFKDAIKRIEMGTPMEASLEKIADETKSKFMKKTIWQIVNALRAGGSLKETLETLIEDLKSEQYARIREYGQELNMMILMYLLFAIAVPSIGATLLIVLSGFGGGGISQTTFVVFGIISMVIQIVLITFIKSRRPAISF